MEIWRCFDPSFAEEKIAFLLNPREREMLGRMWVQAREDGLVRLCDGEGGRELFKVDFLAISRVTRDELSFDNANADEEKLARTFHRIIDGECGEEEIRDFVRSVGLMLIQLWKLTGASKR